MFELSKATSLRCPLFYSPSYGGRGLGDQIYILESSLWLWSPENGFGERPLGGCSVAWTNDQARWASERTGGGGGERRLSGDPSSQAENFLPKP